MIVIERVIKVIVVIALMIVKHNSLIIQIRVLSLNLWPIGAVFEI